MEILNILYNNNLIAVYLIGAILVVILIFIIISSMTTTPKDEKKEILKDPTEEESKPQVLPTENFKEVKVESKDTSKIDDIVEELYQKSLVTEPEERRENKDLNSFLEEFEVPVNVIEEVVNNDESKEINLEPFIDKPAPETSIKDSEELETPKLKEDAENIEDMLKRLYDLRQNENNIRKNILLNEIYELKKQIDETIKKDTNDYSLDYNYIDTKALADYYLFNEDIEFPKLK